MQKTKLFLILSIMAIIAVGFSGCPGEPGGNGGGDGEYIAVSSLNISGGSSSIANTAEQTLTANANSNAHSSLTIEWTNNNNNAIKFIVNGNEANTATGTTVTIRGKLVAVNTSVQITATATTTHPDTGVPTNFPAHRNITVNAPPAEPIPSASWRFDVALAESLGLPKNSTNTDRYDLLTERALEPKTMTGGINVGVSLVPITTGSNILQIRPGTTAGVSGGAMQPSGGNNVAWGKITGVPANVKIGVEFKFTDSGNPTAEQTLADRGTDRYPIITIGAPPTTGAVPTQIRDGTVHVQGQATVATANIEVTSTGTDIFLGIKENIRIFEIKISILESPALISLSLSAEKNTFYEGLDTTLTYTRNPLGAAGELEWVYDEDYFELTDYGNGTAKLEGLQPTGGAKPVMIRAKNNHSINNTVSITVNTLTGNEKFVESVTIDSNNFELFLGSATTTKQLNADVLPIDAEDKSLTWTSDTPGVATVSSTGLVTAVAKGSAIITAKANDGSNQSDSVTVTVKQYVTSIAIGTSTCKFWLNFDGTTGGTITINSDLLTVLPATANDLTVTWSSEDTNVVTINNTNRLVTATGLGTTKIRATANDGSGIFGTVDVEVINFAAICAEFSAPPKHWDFGVDAVRLPGITGSHSIGNTAVISYDGLTIYGARRNGMTLATGQSAGDSRLLTTGSLNGQGSTNNNYVVIDNVQGPFTLIVFYNGGGETTTGRSLNIATAPGGTMDATNGTVQDTSEFGSPFGLGPNMIRYEYTGPNKLDIGFRQIVGGVRVQDVYLFLPSATDVFVSSDKASIKAGVTSGAAPQTAQITAIQDGSNVTETVTWHLRTGPSFESTQLGTAIANINQAGLLTAGLDLVADSVDVYVFAEAGEHISAKGAKVTITKWAPPPPPEIYTFSDFDVETFSAETIRRGLTFGTNATIVTGNGTINGTQYTRSYRSGGNYSAGARFLGIPVSGAATITVFGTSNNSTAVTVVVNGSKINNGGSWTNFELIGQASSVTYPTLPSFKVTAAQAAGGLAVLWAPSNVRIFRIEVHYD
ncbi:MAG: Ig-like domain-containing protein [Treponema sp.]|nr:Ig-like domain-containing protein [Treponema sp.]